jgi:hypothetical protein
LLFFSLIINPSFSLLTVVFQDLRQAESLHQLFDALESLNKVSEEVFTKITQRVCFELQIITQSNTFVFEETMLTFTHSFFHFLLKVQKEKTRLESLKGRIEQAAVNIPLSLYLSIVISLSCLWFSL